MENRFDVIVVGAGNAGLVAAATTAKNGLNTLLLEKHNIPGGCATSFRRGRFEFEPSLHELASVGTAESPDTVYRIFDGLGAKIDWRYEYTLFRVIVKGEDGYDLTLRSGVDTFCDAMEQAVPGCRESVCKLFELVRKDSEALAYISEMNGKPNGMTMVQKHGDFMRMASHSVEDVLKALGMPEKARNIISTYWGYLGVPTDEMNAMHFLGMLNYYVTEGAAMPYKRSHELSLALSKAILDCGGQIWYNSEVTEFLYDEKGAVRGVVANGRELYAKEVISNVIPHNVFNMSRADRIPKTDLKLANARELGISLATVYLGMDCSMEELGIDDYTVIVQGDANPRRQYETRSEFGTYTVNCLNKVIPDSSPEGTCTLFFSIPIFGCDLPDGLKAEDYKRYKNEIARKYIADYEKLMGISIFPHIEEISVATPVTFARYLGTPGGAIYGYKLSRWDSLITRVICEKDEYTIPGLSFCGGHAFWGIGYSSAYITGDLVGKRVSERVKGGK